MPASGRLASHSSSLLLTGRTRHRPPLLKIRGPDYPAYKFAFVCHVTADVFFNAVRAGANDMCALLGTSYTWTGSENDIMPEMVNAFRSRLPIMSTESACAVVDPKAFNAVTDEALGKGIPVVAYNAEAPAGSGSHVMSYIGQDLFQAGVAVASASSPTSRKATWSAA